MTRIINRTSDYYILLTLIVAMLSFRHMFLFTSIRIQDQAMDIRQRINLEC